MTRRVNRRTLALATAALGALVGAAACSGGSPSSGTSPAGQKASISGGETGRYAGDQFQKPQARPSFTLTDTTGRPYDFAARTRGVPTFLYFGYTHCPDFCPATMANIATALRQVPVQMRSKVQVVFVTTDAKRDTPKVMDAWLRHFDPDLPRKFVGLTGTAAQLAAVQKTVGIPVAEDDGQTHSTEVLLFGSDDIARVFYLTGNSPDDMSHDIPLVF